MAEKAKSDSSNKSWRVDLEGFDRQCIPLGDLLEHAPSQYCFCRPTREPMGDHELWIHHAVDAREYFEPDYQPWFQEKPI